MANFDKDDPLGDLLSDGSDDSFFEEPKVLAKRASLTRTPEKKSVTDLFGLDEATASKKNENDWLGLDLEAKKPDANVSKSPVRGRPVKKISFDDDSDDILGNIGLGNKNDLNPPLKKTDESLSTTKLDSSKKTALLESLLGSPKSVHNTTTFDDILGKRDSLTKTPPSSLPQTNPLPNFGFGEGPREGRRSRLQQSTLADPLGLFSNEPNKSNEAEVKTQSKNTTKINKGAGDASTNDLEVIFPSKSKDMATKSAPNITDLPDWLGGGSPVKTNKSEPFLQKEVKETKPNSTVIDEDTKETYLEPKERPQITDVGFDSLVTQQKLAASNIGYQNASLALQQQESQLLMALQLKKYEENLSEMQNQQQNLLLKQEQQFNTLLERQFAKQQIMENNMRLQQERINNHIQLLISQPPVTGAMNKMSTNEEKLQDLESAKTDESGKIYEVMIKNLKQHHHEEMFLLEESYKKQISIIEQTAEATERRLKDEVENVVEVYENKIKMIKAGHEEEIDKYKQYVVDLTNRHKEELRLLRENHDRIIEEIKYEYSTMVENMKHAKQSESNLFENAVNYGDKLDTSLKVLDLNSRTLFELHKKVENDYGVLSKAREESLKAKEEEIKLMKETIEKCRETIEMERTQLLTLVRSLEMKIAEQNQNSREERWALQQAVATFAAKTKALDRESEFNRTSIEREREQLKTLKESFLIEQEKILLQLNEEKLTIAAERSRLETSSKLSTTNFDSQRAKAEIEAAIQVAKEAAEMTDKEREVLQQKQCEIESFKRALIDRERKLAIKERQLQNSIQNAEQRVKDGEKALIEARLLETKYNERFKDIQKQLVSLTNREKKLAEEKIALSKERLALNTQKRQIRKCGLCAVDNNERPENDELQLVEAVDSDYPRLIMASDPDLMRIHFEITENEQNISERLDENFL